MFLIITDMDSQEKPLICELSGATHLEKGKLEKHQEAHTLKSLEEFVCDVFNKSFALEYKLREHQRVHTGEKFIACDICGNIFA